MEFYVVSLILLLTFEIVCLEHPSMSWNNYNFFHRLIGFRFFYAVSNPLAGYDERYVWD